MSARVKFFCPACHAKLKFGRTPKTHVTCPRCGHEFDYQTPAEESEPIAQKPVETNSDAIHSANPKEELGTTAAFGLALKEATEESSRSDVEDELDRVDDEDRDLPEYRPLAGRPRAKKKPAASEEPKPGAGAFIPAQKVRPTPESRPTPRAWKANPMAIGLVSAGALMVLVIIAGGVVLSGLSGREAAKFEPPEKYVPLRLGLMIPVSGIMPEGWESSGGGGGRSGPPIFAKISDGGSISIEIRESLGLKLRQVAAGARVPLPSLTEVHEYFGEATKRNFSRYEEGPERPIETAGFTACISDFSGNEDFFSGMVKGCRASLVHPLHQYNVVCKCPPAQFEDVRPVFEKIISSLGTGDKD